MDDYVLKLFAQLELEKLDHGKRESNRGAMLFDCIDLPWLRLLDFQHSTLAISHQITGVSVF